jgi:hypothetical protein
MAALPDIPANLPAAPRPAMTDYPSWRTPERTSQSQVAWETGPYSVFFNETHVCFPTFGKHDPQTRMLMAGGFSWSGASWSRVVKSDSELAEVMAWARRLYSAFHPGWTPQGHGPETSA